MQPNTKTYLIQALLFVVTLITTTLSGAEWMFGNVFFGVENPMGWKEFWQGFQFSIPFLAILTIHEFGHFFMAKVHRIKVTLPYYIPLWLGISPSIGTMGAFIRIKSHVQTRTQFFDIGLAGPLAGFVAALGVLWYGFTHLPPADYIFTIHPEYARYGLSYPQFVYENKVGNIALGDNVIFWLFKTYVADPDRLPHAFEIIHYPYLFAGYLALFFTSLNLIPIGQLDGGHILFGLIGKKRFDVVAPTLFTVFAFYAGLGLFTIEEFRAIGEEQYLGLMGYMLFYAFFLFICFKQMTDTTSNAIILALVVLLGQLGVSYFFPTWEGYTGFLPFVFLLGRFLGIYHPDTPDQESLGPVRIILGWLSLIIFVLTFSPTPFIVL
jgi:membrane-associated protease RseP (regulator of RpoE activity)